MEPSILVEDLKRIINPILEDNSVELVEFNFIITSGRSMLRLLVDKNTGGISLEDCASLNKQIGAVLDEQDIIKDRFILEVSSPGLDRLLKTKTDFLRCINKKIRLFLNEPVNGKYELEGEISKVEDDAVIIDADKEPVHVSLSKINRGKQKI